MCRTNFLYGTYRANFLKRTDLLLRMSIAANVLQARNDTIGNGATRTGNLRCCIIEELGWTGIAVGNFPIATHVLRRHERRNANRSPRSPACDSLDAPGYIKYDGVPRVGRATRSDAGR